MTEAVADFKIGVIAFLDHASVELSLEIKSSGTRVNRWRLNVLLRQNPTFNIALESYLK